MKSQLNKILFFACLLTLGTTAAKAQDAAVQDYEITESERDRFERDKLIFSPGGENESRYMPPRTTPGGNSTTPSTKDSTASTKSNATQLPAPVKIKHEQPVKPPVKPLPPKDDNDAILSFNLLYYIIQKYKLQEIID